jgi:hypothetical protein
MHELVPQSAESASFRHEFRSNMSAMADVAKLKELNEKTYCEQAKWFLNSFWIDMYEGSLDKAEEQVFSNPSRVLRFSTACPPALELSKLSLMTTVKGVLPVGAGDERVGDFDLSGMVRRTWWCSASRPPRTWWWTI